MLRKVAMELNPTSIITVFDSESGTAAKLNTNNQYKQNRPTSEKAMFDQLSIIKDALQYLDISYIEHPDYEADDVIGSIATGESLNNDIFILSQDKDYYQLISSNISIIHVNKGQIVTITKDVFFEKYGFDCSRYIEFIAIKGDPSDNIPGIKGIGSKAATKLIIKNKHILDECDFELFVNNIESAKLNIKFLSINKDLNIGYNLTKANSKILELSSNNILKELKLYS